MSAMQVNGNDLPDPISEVMTVLTPSTGSTITFDTTPGATLLIINNAALLAALTVTLPSSPNDGQRAVICCAAGVTVLTVSAAASIKGGLTSMIAGGYARFVYSASAGAWFRTG